MDWPSIPWCHWAIRFLNLVTLRHCCSAQLGWFEWFHSAKCFRSRVEVLASISSNSIIVTSLTESLRTQMNDFSHSSPNSDAVHILIPSHSVGLYSIQLNCVSNYNSLLDPASMSDPDFEHIVVGAGINGLWTAYHLASRGARVLILEKVPTISCQNCTNQRSICPYHILIWAHWNYINLYMMTTSSSHWSS